MKNIVVGISGASGAILGQRLIRHLLDAGCQVYAIMSVSARIVWEEELGLSAKDFLAHYGHSERLHLCPEGDFAHKVSSGSSKIDAMVIAPCSLSTVGAIANGITMNLIHRAASVSIKEKRNLVLVPRESPLSPIHLKNLLYLSEIGVHIVPATTAFYHKPKTIEEMVDFTLGRVLDLLKIEHTLFKRWKENLSEKEWAGIYGSDS